jgi:putative N6-adenine-specific DNA methylase
VVPPGLEEPAAAELAALGAREVRPLRRAVACRTDLAGFYRLHLRCRLPFRFLRELARFPCRGRRDLHQGVQNAADWDHWLPPETSFKVEASGSLPELNHSHYTALEVKNALVDLQRQRWGRRSTVDLGDPDLCLHLHLSPGRPGPNGPGPRGPSPGAPPDGEGTAILSLEGGGAGGVGGGAGSLHRRGYRAAMGLAPLKENLAAGLIAHTGWDGSVPLVDPLCGSGTLLLEAAAMALGRAPGLLPAADPAGGQGSGWGDSGPTNPAAAPRPRRFAFQRWPDFDAALWDREVASAAGQERTTLVDGSPMAPILGMERDPQVLEQARANGASAGLADRIAWQLGDFRDLIPPPGPGLLVCNPPYGIRLGADDDLESLYADLGRMVRERCGGWTLWLLSGNPQLSGALRMKASRRIPVSNGGIDCRWLRYEIR